MHKLSPKQIQIIFWIVFIALLSIPVLVNSKLLLFGESTYGKAVDMREIKKQRSPSIYTIIRFEVKNKIVEIYGPENKLYKSDEKIKIIYDKDNPKNYIISTSTYINTRPIAIVCGVLIIMLLPACSVITIPDKKA